MTGRFALALVVLALSACSGDGGTSGDTPEGRDPGGGDSPDGGGGDSPDDGGGATPDGPDPGPGADSYAIRRAEFGTLRARMVSETGEVPTTSADLPATGQAVYSGRLAAGLSGAGLGQRQIIGDLDLVASFGDGTIAGRIDNFRRADDTPVRGSLELRRTALDRGRPGFRGAVDGRLTDGVGAIGVSGTARGTFYGSGAGYLAGDLTGRITTVEGAGRITGDFVTE